MRPSRLLAALCLLAAGGSCAALASGTLALGLALGVKHATEGDHVAAVSAIVSEDGSLERALWTGMLWGAGHTLAILVAGLAVLGLQLVVSDALARGLELGVAGMIVVLAAGALVRALDSPRAEEARPHLHADSAGEPPRRGLRPLLVGVMHGLAGSAALTLLVLAQVRSPALALLYLLLFGVGSVGGMAAMSVAIAVPFAATSARPALQRGIRIATAALTLGFGLFYGGSRLLA